MIFEKAQFISRVDENTVLLATRIKNSCQGCQHNSQCGTGVIAKTMTPKTNQVLARCSQPLEEGQDVVVQIQEQDLLMASALMYGLPLLGMMGLMLLSHLLFSFADIATVVAGGVGLTLGLWWAKRASHQRISLPEVVNLTTPELFHCVKDD